MNWLRSFLDKIKPNFEKGGKLYFLHSTFDAFEVFFYVPNKVTEKGSHIRDYVDSKRLMTHVLIALAPLVLFGMFNVGLQHFRLQLGLDIDSWGQVVKEAGFWRIFWYGFLRILPIIVVSYVSGLAVEFASAQIRHHQVNEGFLVTGMLIALIVPPTIPLWMLSIATIFAVIFGKEVFGGTGMNFLNPALLTRAFLFFAYPASMTGDAIWVASKGLDVISGPTPLALAAQNQFAQAPSLLTMSLGFTPGAIGETSKILIILGAIYLIFTGVANLRVMISAIVGAAAMGLIFNLWGANEYMQIPFYYHFFMGGFLFGAVFMATDPVTSAQTPTGKIYYGLLIGILCILIRVVNPAYPEGAMLAILLMNVFAPLIDHLVVQQNINRRKKRALLSQTIKS
jgi:Na+-transporting NADH:ubiquinone oxidoreductase subunit B